ncbi:MAG: AAA family ATPase [Planctomycetes bacterium]|nr:AAA family ATPase [Planctomycetota bacterium]
MPTALSARPDPISLFHALRRRWGLAAGLGLGVAFLTAMVTWVGWPAQYTTYALLRVASEKPRLVFDTAESKGDFGTYQRTQAQLIKSRFVLNAALRKPGVAELNAVRQQADPVNWLAREIMVDFPGGSEVMRIAMSGQEATEVAALVNAVHETYLQEIVNKERDQRLARLNELESNHNSYEARVRAKRSAYRELARTLGTSDSHALTYKQQMALEHFAQLKGEVTRLRFERMRAEVRSAAEKSGSKPEAGLQAPAATPAAMNETQIEADEVVQQKLHRIAQLRDLINRYAEVAVNKDEPSLEVHRRELETTEKALAERRSELRHTNATELQNQIALLAEQEKLLAEEVTRYGDDIDKIGTSSSDLELLRMEITQVDNVANRIGAEMEALRVELASPPRITLLQPADVPQTKDVNRKAKAVGMAAIGAFGAVAFLVSLVEWRNRRVNSTEEVARGLGLRIFGSLPSLRPRGLAVPWGRGTTVEARELLSESVDALRTMLLHDAREKSLQVVMITSAMSGEGKTTVASHLAMSLARAGRKTLLVDCDLRRPSVHQLFELPLQPGLSEVLRSNADVFAVLRPSATPGLDILTAGQGDRIAVQALSGTALPETFARLRGEYDFIVVDSCPVLPVADALWAAQQADGVIFAVLRDVSRLPLMYTACDRLSQLGIRLLGAVVSGNPAQAYGYGYGYGARPNEPKKEQSLGLREPECVSSELCTPGAAR